MAPGRNEPCPCGSGKKYKACCGRLTGAAARAGDAAPPAPDPVPPAELHALRECLESGRATELAERAETLLRAWPESGLVWHLLGIARTKEGNDGLAALTEAARLLPGDPVVRLNLGNALARAGRLVEAASQYRDAVSLQPAFTEAHLNLGDVLMELGEFDAAAASCGRALELRPASAESHLALGRALLRLRRFEEAAASCRRAIEIRPDYAEANNSLGIALQKLADVERAIDCFKRAVALRPEFVEAHANLANALRTLGRLDEAVASYGRALQLNPGLGAVHTELGTALRLLRRTAESEASCNRALELDPDSSPTLAVLAELRADQGRFAEAEALFKRAVAVDPDAIEAWAGLVRVRRMAATDRDWLAGVQRLVARGLPPEREMQLQFALGKFFDDTGGFGEAFESYLRANELAKRLGPAHDRARLARTIDRIVHEHDRRFIDSVASDADATMRPVFVVGMLRSGTSLVEQILASHDSVHGAGELTFWTAALAAAIDGADAGLRIPGARLSRLARTYLEQLGRLSADAERVIDKMPTNFLALGLIHAAFPQARIIHVRRNPADTCLSIYFQHFEAANAYANDLADLAHYYGEYRRLMRHWRTVIPPASVLEVSYEALTLDVEGVTRRMLEFVGLPWDPRCLDFHQNARSVVTASKWQVRQPIDTTAAGRWRRYERFIGPLLPLLDLEAEHH